MSIFVKILFTNEIFLLQINTYCVQEQNAGHNITYCNFGNCRFLSFFLLWKYTFAEPRRSGCLVII